MKKMALFRSLYFMCMLVIFKNIGLTMNYKSKFQVSLHVIFLLVRFNLSVNRKVKVSICGFYMKFFRPILSTSSFLVRLLGHNGRISFLNINYAKQLRHKAIASRPDQQ